MNLRSALDALMEKQANLVIEDPIEESIRKVWKYTPESVTETPCWRNTWTLNELQYEMSAVRERYTVTAELVVKDADLEQAADIATAFYEAFIVEMGKDQTLGGEVLEHDIRGDTPTLHSFDEAGLIGVTLFIDLDLLHTAVLG